MSRFHFYFRGGGSALSFDNSMIWQIICNRRLLRCLKFIVPAFFISLMVMANIRDERPVNDESLNNKEEVLPTVIKAQQKQKCEIPQLDPWDPTIKKFLQIEPSTECPSDNLPLVRLTWSKSKTSLLELTSRGQRELPHIRCFYQTFTRSSDDQTVNFDKEVVIRRFPIEMPGEYVRIVCREKSNDDAEFYKDVFGSIEIKRNNNPTRQINDKWNVMIIGIDSVSRQNFIRFMPKTYEWLTNNQKITGGVHLFNAYHKIGENTFPNLVAMLTGRKVELSLPRDRLQLPHSGDGAKFDSYPFIWKEFANAGYVTGYAEDNAKYSTFNFMRQGFSETPTTHYGRPLLLAAEADRGLIKSPASNISQMNETTTLQMDTSDYCINGRKRFQILWDYAVRQFITRYQDVAPTFMFSWVVHLTHKLAATLKQGDLPLLETLKFLTNEKSSWRNNTFVFLVSDHGQRVDDIRSTLVGRLENRLPFSAVLVPPSFSKKFPKLSENLSKNTDRLVTALDIYATLKHILHLSNDKNADDDFNDFGPSGYGASLFTEINEMRSCAEAGIPSYFCACIRYSELSVDSQLASLASTTLQNSIQADLSEAIALGLCAKLRVVTIDYFKRADYSATFEDGGDAFDDFIIQVTMEPGDGKFEATIRNHRSSSQKIIGNSSSSSWKRIGGVERVNRYGSQSACLTEKFEPIRHICYCPVS